MLSLGEHRRRTKHTVTFFSAEDIKDEDDHNSASFKCEPWSRFLLLVDLAATLTPTRIEVQVEFSDNGTDFYEFMNGPFGLLQYEDTMCPVKDSQSELCGGKYIRITVTAVGANATNYFTISVKVIFFND